jgi:hypothetical protein
MFNKTRFGFTTVPATLGIALVMSAGAFAQAQNPTVPDEYQAQAMGQGTQLGQSYGVTIHIEQYSTPEERTALMGAFQAKGSQGLYNALNKMHSKGRVALTGTVGYDISFARYIPNPDGTYKIRVITNRPITFGEAWADSTSMEYNLSAFELDISSVKNKSGGTLLPAIQLVMNKKTNELEIQDYQNPWKLVDVINWDEKDKKKK